MQKKVLFSIFTLLSLFVIVLLVVLLNGTNSDQDSYSTFQNSSKSKKTAKKTTTEWTEKLSSYKQRDYLFPVTDLFILIKNKNKKKIAKKVVQHKKEKLFSLSINKLNDYSLFCILRILEDSSMPFAIEKGYGDSKLYVNAKNRDDLQELSKKFKKYNIVYTIQTIDKQLK